VLLCHAAAQLAAQQCRDLRLIWLVDVDRLARAAGMDWDDLLRVAEAWRLGFALHAALADAGAWLGPAAPKPVAAALGRLAGDRVAQAIWGAADPAYGAPWRRVAAILPALPPRTALAAARCVAGRAALRPLERWAGARARQGQ
jgi:hypothetical protein